MQLVIWILGLTFALVLFIAIVRWIARPSDTEFESSQTNNATRLVVLVHGLSGRDKIDSAIDLAKDTLQLADFLVIRFDSRIISNASVYEITNLLEARIHETFDPNRHQSVLLIGHSVGAMILRKCLLWAHGVEEDRVAPKGPRPWAEKVERLVSLAGINRGWSIQPRPENMAFWRYLAGWVGERAARMTGTSKLVRSLKRGAPFIADARVQWVRLARRGNIGTTTRRLPQVIHLLGDKDDIVSRKDAQDLGVVRDTIFVTLAGTNHRDIAAALHDNGDENAAGRRAAIRHAMLGELDQLSLDEDQTLEEEPSIKRIIYIVHGIRDYGEWTDRLREAIASSGVSKSWAVVNQKYGYFPMGPFLLYADRQRNVRKFMDEYTENIAQYPNAERCDFVGHSNGTYILASALQHYKTLEMGRVYFAGSVVPKHYPWRDLLDRERVERVVNVVASGDWVVALFPKLFEQIANWRGTEPTTGFLDIGAAGFRGFQDADDPMGRVRNLQFAAGQHSVGVDVSEDDKLQAIVQYVLHGKEQQLDAFEDATHQWAWLDVLSNISWIVWVAIVAILIGVGLLAFGWHWGIGAGFVIAIILLLNSI